MILKDFAISPDGRTVAFQYFDQESKRHGLGLYEWETGKLTPIPNPPGKHRDIGGGMSFSYDGKRLAAMASDPTSGHVAIIDLATLQITQLAPAGRIWDTPVFQPGTDNVLFLDGGPGIRKHLKLLNLSDGTVQTVLEEKDGFGVGILQPSFVSQNEIIFQAIAPKDAKLVQEVADITKQAVIGKDTTSAKMVYRLQLGGRPELILKEITAHSARDIEGKGLRLGPRIGAVSASRDGKVIIFTDLSSVTPQTKGVGYNYEIFKLEDGKLTQMTHLLGYLYRARVSYDGSTVAFGSSPKRRLQDVDLFMLDVRSGEVRPTHLLEKLAEHPEFILP